MRCGCRGGNWIPLGAAFLASCAGAAPESSPRPPPVPSAKPAERSELISAARAWPRAGPPFVSSGHGGGEFTIDIRISPASLDQFRALVLGQSVATGTEAVAFHTRAGAAESAYAMVKQPDGAWEFIVTDSEARVRAKGNLALCARCHEDAPADFLFVPSALRPSQAVRGVDTGS